LNDPPRPSEIPRASSFFLQHGPPLSSTRPPPVPLRPFSYVDAILAFGWWAVFRSPLFVRRLSALRSFFFSGMVPVGLADPSWMPTLRCCPFFFCTQSAPPLLHFLSLSFPVSGVFFFFLLFVFSSFLGVFKGVPCAPYSLIFRLRLYAFVRMMFRVPRIASPPFHPRPNVATSQQSFPPLHFSLMFPRSIVSLLKYPYDGPTCTSNPQKDFVQFSPIYLCQPCAIGLGARFPIYFTPFIVFCPLLHQSGPSYLGSFHPMTSGYGGGVARWIVPSCFPN